MTFFVSMTYNCTNVQYIKHSLKPMRPIITILLSLHILTAYSQNAPISIADAEFNAQFFKTPKPIVSGKIINASKKDLAELKITYSLVNPFLSVQTNGIASINKDGSFKFNLEYPFPYQELWINLGDYFYSGVYVNKGTNLELDLAQLKKHSVEFNGKGVKYKGRDGEFNLWRNDLRLYKRKQQSAIYDELYKLQMHQPDYIVKLDSLHNLLKSIYSEYITKNPSPLSTLSENDRLCDYYSSLLKYMQITKKELPVWKQIKNHKALMISNSASMFNYNLFNYANYKAQTQNEAIDKILGIYYADMLKLKAGNRGVIANEQEFGELTSTVHTHWVKEVLRKQHYNALRKLDEVKAALNSGDVIAGDLVVGQPVAQYTFGAKLSSVSKTKATQFLAKLHNKFKGKAMIIDMWATWCGPCIADLPYSSKLHNEAANLPVEFVYLCTSSGSSIEKWKNKITELKQSGTHIFIDQPLTNELLSLFGKSGFPSYVCIDTDGKVSTTILIERMQSVSLNDIKKLIIN
ncbi:TlpA family protein disulfide reductase [Mucilaginibacter aquatilis]|uniref:Redoxin family protein n=1 Tax=Mucilaginibacter aquatilis TaxID=1517760 RepID=A0A6I4I4P9_9SPHI|nr:TlpA disulfide reductase family protein [Mucilaginibacter aquatilis]MVN90102.1 redoxin family protein [Mucilaginibacter aquatilis]